MAEILEVCLEMEEEERRSYLEIIGASDADLRRQVESMLEQSSSTLGTTSPESPSIEPTAGEAPFEFQQIGPYRTIEWLGMGGMGTVYRAARADHEFEREVAIKVIRVGVDVPEVRRRFLSERQILATFDHPHIAKMYEGGTTKNGYPYLVMEYIDGSPIDRYCDQNRLSIRRRLELFNQVCSAVQYAHRNLVVHRDLKPSNILVTAEGVPKLLDFGIAKLLAPEEFPLTIEATATGAGPLTPNYASPEQIRGERITTSSDLFSLGVLLYRLITGRLPFDRRARSREKLAELTAKEIPTKPSAAIGESSGPGTADSSLWSTDPGSHRRDVRGDLDNIVLMTLRPEPDRRYSSVEQLADDISRHLDGRPVQAREASSWYLLSRFAKRYRYQLTAAVLLFAMFLTFLGVALTQNVRIRSQALELRSATAEAKSQASKARDEARRSQSVAEFFIDLFAQLSPRRQLGREVTGREILDVAADRILEDKTGDSVTRVQLMTSLSTIYSEFGDPKASLSMAEQAVLESDAGSGVTEAKALLALGGSRYLLGEIDEAVEPLETGLEILRTADDTTALTYALKLTASVVSESSTQDLDRALRLGLEALELTRSSQDIEAELSTLNSLSKIYRLRNEADNALAASEQVVELGEKFYSPLDPRLAISYSNLAYEYQFRGRIAEIFRLLEKTHLIMLEVHGEEGMEAASSFNNLAWILNRIGDPEQAEAHARTAMTLLEQSAGGNHPMLVTFANQLGDSLRGQGESTAAAETWRKALEASRGAPEPSRLNARIGLIFSSLDAGRLELARTELGKLDKVLEQLASAGPKVAPTIPIFSRTAHALLAHLAKSHDLARDTFEEVIAKTEILISGRPGTDLNALKLQLLALLYLDRHDEALELIERLEPTGWNGDPDLRSFCARERNSAKREDTCRRLRRGLLAIPHLESA